MDIKRKNLTFTGTPAELESIKYFVIHHTASQNSTLESIHRWHQEGRGWYGIGYHYVITRDGDIFKGREDNQQGVHAGTFANQESIGIALVGDFENNHPTSEQLDSLSWLFKDHLFPKHGELVISGHNDHMNTACPGRNFPWNDLYERMDDMSDIEKTKINMFGKEVEAIKYDSKTYIHIRELEKIQFKVNWENGETEVVAERRNS